MGWHGAGLTGGCKGFPMPLTMPVQNDALPHDESLKMSDAFPRPAEYGDPAPPPASGSIRKLLTFGKAPDDAMADFPSEHKATPVWVWALVALVASTAIVASALMFGPKWRLSAAVPQTGQLVVLSQPAGGDVIVDGQRRGVTPLTLSLMPGPHALQLNRADVSRSIPVTIKAGAETTHFVDLDTRPVPEAGQLVVSSEPPGARVSIDGQERGVTPVTLADIAAGEHSVVIQGASGPVQRSVTVQKGQSASLLVSMMGQAAFGWVSISSPVVLQVLEDDRKLGTSETDRIVLPAGQHTLRVLNQRLGFQTARVVHIPAGGGASVKIDPPNGVVNLNALPWAEAWIDGRQVGETPLGNINVPIGEHEVVFRHPQFGERRQTFLVTANEPARVAVDFRK
jgi:PEGA domain